jgi:hypothetical protein
MSAKPNDKYVFFAGPIGGPVTDNSPRDGNNYGSPLYAPTPLSVDTWTHVALQRRERTWGLYIDYELVSAYRAGSVWNQSPTG